MLGINNGRSGHFDLRAGDRLTRMFHENWAKRVEIKELYDSGGSNGSKRNSCIGMHEFSQ